MIGLALNFANKQPSGYWPQRVSCGAGWAVGQSFWIGARLVELARFAARIGGVEGLALVRANDAGAAMADFCRFLVGRVWAVARLIVARLAAMADFCCLCLVRRLIVNLHDAAQIGARRRWLPPLRLSAAAMIAGGAAPLSPLPAIPIPLAQGAAGMGKSFRAIVPDLFQMLAEKASEVLGLKNGVGGLGVGGRASRAEKSAQKMGLGLGIGQVVELLLVVEGRARLGRAFFGVN